MSLAEDDILTLSACWLFRFCFLQVLEHMARVNGKLDVLGLDFSGQQVVGDGEKGDSPRFQAPGLLPYGPEGVYPPLTRRRGKRYLQRDGGFKCLLMRGLGEEQVAGGRGEVWFDKKHNVLYVQAWYATVVTHTVCTRFAIIGAFGVAPHTASCLRT